MRRQDREIKDPAVIEDILKRAKIVHLGLCDDGAPYVVPMHYGYLLEAGKLTLYVHGANEGRKYDVLAKNNRVCAEIDTDAVTLGEGDVACVYGSTFSSVIAFGTAKVLTDIEEKRTGLKVFMKTQTGRDFEMPDAAVSRVNVIRIDVDEFTCKAKYDAK